MHLVKTIFFSQITKFRPKGLSNVPPQTVVGVHIAYDKIVSALREQLSCTEANAGGVDVLVCSLGHKTLLKEKLSVLKEFWKLGISATLLHDSSQVLCTIRLGFMKGLNYQI